MRLLKKYGAFNDELVDEHIEGSSSMGSLNPDVVG
jgi:hypothetical protein